MVTELHPLSVIEDLLVSAEVGWGVMGPNASTQPFVFIAVRVQSSNGDPIIDLKEDNFSVFEVPFFDAVTHHLLNPDKNALAGTYVVTIDVIDPPVGNLLRGQRVFILKVRVFNRVGQIIVSAVRLGQ